MGCSSSSPSPAHAECERACQSKTPIDLEKLQKAVKSLDLISQTDDGSQLNLTNGSGFTCLDVVALCEDSENSAKAAEILIKAGADPLRGKDFHCSAISKTIKYSSLHMLAAILKSFDGASWKVFITGLTKPIENSTTVDENVWVIVKKTGKKGKTGMHVELNPVGTDRHNVAANITYEDGSKDSGIYPKDLTILPQATSKVLSLIHDCATDAQVPEEVIKPLKGMEESDREVKGNFQNGWLTVVAALGVPM